MLFNRYLSLVKIHQQSVCSFRKSYLINKLSTSFLIKRKLQSSLDNDIIVPDKKIPSLNTTALPPIDNGFNKLGLYQDMLQALTAQG